MTMRILEVHYLGRTKDHNDGLMSAFAYLNTGFWGAVFPEDVLKKWFEIDFEPNQPEKPGKVETLYSVLGARHDANSEELRTAFRRMARQWHPDLCRESGAEEMFKKINHANSILSDTRLRARYDAGLSLEATLKQEQQPQYNWSSMSQNYTDPYGYRSPLRCGQIMVTGAPKAGKFYVDQILEWQDIIKNNQTLVVSWPMGAKQPLEVWN